MLIYLLFLLIITLIILSIKKPINFPPGPRWLPIVGCLPAFKKIIKKSGNFHLAIQNLAKEYQSDIIGLKLGVNKTICVLGFDNIKKILTSNEYDGKPNSFFFHLRSVTGRRNGITFTDGPLWQEQRPFVMRHLREMGFGKKTMDEIIVKELQELFLHFDEHGKNIKMNNYFGPTVLTVLWNLTAGMGISRDDPKVSELLSLLERRQQAFDMSGGMLNHLPFLRFIAPETVGYNLIRNLNKELKDFFMKVIQEHYATYTGDSSDLIFAFIKEMIARTGDKNSRFTEDQLLMVCVDLFIAGAQTTSSMLEFLCYELVTKTNIQKKIQQEIDNIVPKSRLPNNSDRARLPYTEAFLLEIKRKYPIAPISGPRRVLNDTILGNYTIAKDTTILYSIWSVHMDENYWKDPHTFRPERFIDNDGNFVPDERVITLSLGKRRCPGEALVKSLVFLFTAGILQNFNILPVPNTIIPKNIIQTGIMMSAASYRIQFVRR